MMYLFFDTETTGTPKNYRAPISELDNWPRVIQLAWALFDEDGLPVASRCDLIKPDGWEMPTAKFWLDNGFSQQESMEKGIPISNAIDGFLEALECTETLVAHNMKFDLPIVSAEMLRLNVSSQNKPKKFCTMESTTNLCCIPGPYGLKWPKLEELHQHLFGTKFDGAHDALNDVMACAKCFFHLKTNKLIEA